MIRENTPKSPEAIILASVILGSKIGLRSYAINALRNCPNKHCENLKTVHIMANSFNTYQRYPKIPLKDSFKSLPLINSSQSRRRSVNTFPLIKSSFKKIVYCFVIVRIVLVIVLVLQDLQS